jgi:hypothetical protein
MSCRVRFNFFKMGDREEVRYRCCDSQLFEGELLDTPLLEIPFNFEEFMKSQGYTTLYFQRRSKTDVGKAVRLGGFRDGTLDRQW